MISQILNSTPLQAFISGFAIGGMCFGGMLGIIGWFIGHDHAMRKVGGWMRSKKGEVHGDVPNLPPVRERRLGPTAHREWLS